LPADRALATITGHVRRADQNGSYVSGDRRERDAAACGALRSVRAPLGGPVVDESLCLCLWLFFLDAIAA
jgi:hypothetical protein